MSAPADLQLTFLGHQTWHISDGHSVILLDPIIARAFGAGDLEFVIWPPRTVDHGAMPTPDALILSHEHLDHFHLPSLNLLPRTVPIYTGPTTPAAVTEAISALGFTVHRADHTEPIRVGAIEVHLFPAGARTLFWEKRVAQPLVRIAGTTGQDVFIGVDADVSDLYLEELSEGTLTRPRLAIVSNNAQTVPYGALGADNNLLPGMDGPRNRRTGIEILHSLLIDYLAPLGDVPEVALCGNGFTAPRSPHGPFLYADALDGATHVRPDGWLRTPLTTNVNHAEAQARNLLRVRHPQAPGPVQCVSARYRTAAFALGSPPSRLLKRHADEAAYLGEMLAYQLLADEDVLPVLHSSSDITRSLVVEYLDQCADLTDRSAFEELTRAVAVIHTASARWHREVAETMSAWRMAEAVDSGAPGWVRNPEPWVRLMRLVADAHGQHHIPLGHLDLKPDHVRRRSDGRLVLIDVETLRPDLTGLPDLVTLAYISGDIAPDIPPNWVRHSYVQHISTLGAQWTDTALRNALLAFANATGLRSLHGVET